MRRRSQEVLQVVARKTGLAFPPVICVQQLSVTLSHEFGSLSPHSAFSVLRVVLFRLVPTLFACRGLWFNSQPMNEVENELSTISPDLLRLAQQRNSTALLLDELPRRFLPQVIAEVGPPQRTWELTGLSTCTPGVHTRRWESFPLYISACWFHNYWETTAFTRVCRWFG